jgi:hypothetical protein
LRTVEVLVRTLSSAASCILIVVAHRQSGRCFFSNLLTAIRRRDRRDRRNDIQLIDR